MERKIISIASFTRFYYGKDGGKKYGTRNALYTDWCSAQKVFDLIGGTSSFKVEMFVGFYSDEERKLDSEYLVGKKISPAMKELTGFISPYRLKKFIEEKELDVNDYTYIRKEDAVIFDSGNPGELRIIFPHDDTAFLCALLQTLDAPKNILKMLLDNVGSMIKVFPDGRIHSIEKIKNFNDDYFEADFFEKFPEVQGRK